MPRRDNYEDPTFGERVEAGLGQAARSFVKTCIVVCAFSAAMGISHKIETRAEEESRRVTYVEAAWIGCIAMRELVKTNPWYINPGTLTMLYSAVRGMMAFARPGRKQADDQPVTRQYSAKADASVYVENMSHTPRGSCVGDIAFCVYRKGDDCCHDECAVGQCPRERDEPEEHYEG